MDTLLIRLKKLCWKHRESTQRLMQNVKRLPRLLWHPHQRLWNWELVRAVTRRKIPHIESLSEIPRSHRIIIFFDTALLWFSAVTRRIRRCGVLSVLSSTSLPVDTRILYLDLGTHREGRELAFMVDEILPNLCKNFLAYGFEASSKSVADAKKHFSGNRCVTIIHAALCYRVPEDGQVTLYIGQTNGLGSSLYRFGQGPTEQAPAIRLSEWFKQSGIDLGQHICLLRMNIEGAEYDVVKDLVEDGTANLIDGFFGMWDDLSKIDAEKDRAFRQFLKRSAITTFTFNGRDLEFGQRKKCIEYEVHTAARMGLERLRGR